MRGRCPGPFQWTGGHFVKLLDVTFAPFLSTRVLAFHHFTPLATFIRSFLFCVSVRFKRVISERRHFSSGIEHPLSRWPRLWPFSLFSSVVGCWVSLQFYFSSNFILFFSQFVSVCLVWIIARFLLDQSSLCTDTSYTATSSFEILTNDSLFM